MRLLEKGDIGYYDPVPCPLPQCGQPLHLTYTADQLLYASSTEEDLNGYRPGDMSAWDVRCEAGHVILLPPDDGQESHLFGTCSCDPADVKDHGHDEGCANGDFERLRGVISMASRDCPNCLGTGKIASGTSKEVDCPFCHGTGRR